MGEQVELLEYHANRAADFVQISGGIGQRGAIDNDLAGFMRLKAVDTADQRGFSRSRRATNHHAFSGSHIKRHVFERLKIAKKLGHIAH